MKSIKKIIKLIIPWMDISNKIYRIYVKSNKWSKRNIMLFSEYYRYKILKKYNCAIAPQAEISSPIIMPHPIGIVIGMGTKIGENVTIYQSVTIGQKEEKYPTIGNNVIVYPGAKIIGKVTIGDNAIIGPNAVVIKDVPKDCIAVGIPARIIEKDKK